MKPFLHKIFLTSVMVLAALLLPGCADDFDYGRDTALEGEADITATVSFQPVFADDVDQSASTRSVSDAFQDSSVAPPGDTQLRVIERLWILFYDTDRKLIPELSRDVTSIMDKKEIDRPSPGTNAGHASTDTKTPKATFELKGIPAGRYYIYAVANINTDKSDSDALSFAEFLDKVPDVDALRSHRLEWHKYDFHKNIEMLGVFTTGEVKEAENDGIAADNLVTVTPSLRTMHAWAQRAVAKITIDFDGSQLRNNVKVFIKEARLVTISNGAYLGKPGKIGSEASDFKEGETVHKLKYAADGTDFHTWPSVSRGSGKLDSYVISTKEGGKTVTDTVKFHDERAKCLIAYENLQGDGELKYQDRDGDGYVDHPDSGNKDSDKTGNGKEPDEDKSDIDNRPSKEFYKDGKPYGTYLEVDGYYVSTNNDYISDGHITYRFMLGGDVEKNYDLKRNHHYKVTMAFRGNGNDVDWHVEYKEIPPKIFAYDVLASYGYNETVTIPVRVLGGEVVKLKAKIIENNWHPEGANNDRWFECSHSSGTHKMSGNDYFYKVQDGTEHPEYGFLSLYPSNQTPKDLIKSPKGNGDDETYLYLHWFWNGSHDVINDTGEKNQKLEGPVTYSPDKFYFDPNNPSNNETTYKVKAYTRQKNMVKSTGYSGMNVYQSGKRVAKVEFSGKVNIGGDIKDLDPVVVTVRQTERLANPMGVYRKHDNTASFKVLLSIADVEPNNPEKVKIGKYTPIRSEGPWRAVIENVGNPEMISLSKYWGDHGSEVDFDINFNGTTPEGESRFAIVSIWYNNYSCHHRIFVRQGYAPTAVIPGEVKWHAGNVSYWNEEDKDLKDVKHPLDEGSLFRYAALKYPLSSVNQYNFTFNQDPGNAKLELRETVNTIKWSDIQSPGLTGMTKAEASLYQGVEEGYPYPNYSIIEAYDAYKRGVSPTSHSTYKDAMEGGKHLLETMATRPASHEDFYKLYNDPNTDFAYGVIYGDDSKTTATDMLTAFGHNSEQGYTNGCGMRCVIVYNRKNGRHVAFPIGASGFGHRQHNSGGALRYAGRKVLMDHNLAVSRPMFWDIMYTPGAIYWTAMFDYNHRMADGGGAYRNSTAWDINYKTFDFFTYGQDAFNKTDESNACFIRMVDKP